MRGDCGRFELTNLCVITLDSPTKQFDLIEPNDMLRQRNTCLLAPLSLAVLGLLSLLGTGGQLPAQESVSLTDTRGFGQSKKVDLGDALSLIHI